MAKPLKVDRNVPTAGRVPVPLVQRNVPIAKNRPVPFRPRFFGPKVVMRLMAVAEDSGLPIDHGTFVVAHPDFTDGTFDTELWLTRATHDLIVRNDGLITEVQAALATGIPMGVKSKLVDIRQTPAWDKGDAAVVDRGTTPIPDTLDISTFAHRVTGLCTDLMGFDASQMSDQVRIDFIERYGKLRDEARTYREAMQRVDGALEFLQGKVKEMVE